MKRTLIGFLLGLGMLCAHAQDNSGQPTSRALPTTSVQSDEEHEHTLKVRRVCIGIGATTSVMFILAGCYVIYSTLSKTKKEREMRRIASLDG